MLIVFQTDYLVISRLFGAEQVVIYNVAFKYFALTTTYFGLIVTPFWSAATEAFNKQDHSWIRMSVSKLKKIYWMFFALSCVMLVISSWFFRFWLNEAIIVPFSLSVAMFVYTQLINWSSIYVTFINGSGKIKLQLIFSGIGTILNIPMSIYFAKYLHLGLAGIILASSISIFYGYVIAPIQLNKILKNRI